MKKIKKYAVLIVLLCTFLIGTDFVKATEGEILADKTAIKDDITYGRKATVKLDINANQFSKVDKTDVILVIDRSTSMAGTKMTDTLNATKELINKIITNETKEKVRMGIVVYGNNIFENYTTNLTNDGQKLLSLVDNITSNYNEEGTNIHAGLLKAEVLLSDSTKDTNKIIILLTDGEPYQYIGINGEVCKNDKSNKKNCKKTPIDAALEVAGKLKQKDIIIYTVGFDIKTNTTAQKVLTDISTDPDNTHSYLADNYIGLKNSFDNMVKNFSVVATDGIITDIIPKGFKLISTLDDATSVLNNDGTTTITWNIGDISSLVNNTLSYNIEALNTEYGSMYTNKSAILTAKPVSGNPKYESDISIELNIPNVAIPSITKDDTYSLKHGETLTISKENGILKNDLLTHKNLDKDAVVTDKIVLVGNNTNDIDIKDDGSFTYKSNNKGVVTYEYYIESTILINDKEEIVKSNTSKIILNIDENKTYYIVNYLEEGTNKILGDNKKENGNVYDIITENAINITGYTLIGDVKQTLTLKEKDNIINYYYKVDDALYTVNYLEEGTNKILFNSKNVYVNYDDVITENAIDIKDYKLVNEESQTIKIKLEDNTINFYYKKVNGTVKSIYVDSSNKEISDSIILTDLIGNDYKTAKKDIKMYKLIKIDGEERGKYTDKEIVITYIYEKVPDTGLFKKDNSGNITLISLISFGLLLLIRKKIFN